MRRFEPTIMHDPCQRRTSTWGDPWNGVRLHGVMATNYWASSQCQRWVLRHADIEAARDEDRRYVDPLELEAITVWCINSTSEAVANGQL